ncbi:MAG: HlyD family efflux transporter periplasmic adaptor subunit [Candidatus Binatia bacterium]
MIEVPTVRAWCIAIPSFLAAAGVLAVWQQGGLAREAVAVIEERPRPPVAVTALGRIQPKDGVVRIAGPSGVSVVIAELLVEQGDRVAAGAVVARLDQWELRQAGVTRARAEFEHADRELRRFDRLFDEAIVSAAERDARRMRARIAAAEVALAEAELALAMVRAPVAGQVLKVHARAGEKVGPDGIAELGRTDPMYVVAEVYETDVGRVRLGQRATVSSPALDGVLEGTVERVGLMVGRKDVLGNDPVDEADARVVEVEVRLDDGARVAALTHLQVEVAIRP